MSALSLQAQIKIAGSVYGGGNEGDVEGKTSVTVHAGDLNEVYGGARKANVNGQAFVNIDGENASSYILANRVYGGNDISGTIGSSETVPDKLTAAADNGVTEDWNAFVRVSSSNTTDKDNQVGKVYLGQLFGGGNGAYDYTSGSYEGLNKPELDKTYLEIVGGSIVYAFGGGNNATVKTNTVIYVNNESEVVNSIKDADGNELLTDARIKAMGYNPGFTYPTSAAFQIGSFFGGNNLAEMKIQPKWNLQRGKIRNLYSGGNRGEMTSPIGLLLEIDPQGEEKNKLIIDNVYGGCRMADVHPKDNNGNDVAAEAILLPDVDDQGNPKYNFPAGLSARVLVRGGDINNVYGGNDISGRVYGGNAVGIYSSIRGDVYGGGNGAYPYTDNPALKDDPTYGDLYYTVSDGKTSAQALNDFRPNAEQVSLRLLGTEDKPTIIGGSVYIGGNCATLATTKEKPMVELKIGSYVYADNVFLGNNGEGMVQKHEADPNDEEHFHDGVLRTYKKTLAGIDATRYPDDTTPFSTMDLTGATTFNTYMEGVVMGLMPSVTFDSDYEEYSTYFGSFYCGGNIGSMRCNGKTPIDFSDKLVIYNKLVGGCNNANVVASDFNAAYDGGLLGTPDSNGDKLQLTFTGLKIQPKRWKKTYVTGDNTYTPTLSDGEDWDPNSEEFPGYVVDANGNHVLEWNTVSASTGNPVAPITSGASEADPVTSVDDDLDRRLTGGNIYGGCYNSGHVNGNVIINLEETIFDREIVFDEVEFDTQSGEPKLYGNDNYKITKRHSGVILDMQGMDVLGAALNVFGGGYGKDSEIWGSTTINLKTGYTFQIFGGGEQGVIGKPTGTSTDPDGTYDSSTGVYAFNGKTFKYDRNYSCIINVSGDYPGVYRGHANDSPDMAEAEFIYGGGFIGPVCGDAIIKLNNGRVFNTFAGSCNADILGHTETYVGSANTFPYVRDYVYGGNDLGGKILGLGNFESRVRTTANGGYDARGKVSNVDMLNASAYVEYMQGRVEKIYGGCYGVYDYTDAHYGDYFYNTGGEGTTDDNLGTARPGFSKPWLDNAFVNFRPEANASNAVDYIYGAGEGYSGEPEENKLQNRSYILVDIPQGMTAFQNTEIFGAGERGGVGMSVDPASAAAAETAHKASAIIDLARGQIMAVYGGSYEEGITRRTVVNVPAGSTIKLEKIFGGAYGTSLEHPCDVYESNVNWSSSDALVGNYRTGIYGGNNAFRRTLYSKVNINAPVYYDKANEYYATVYGAGYGKDTWAQYTEVNMNNTAQVYEVYGGGQLGRVMNKNSVAKWASTANAQATADYETEHAAWEALSAEEQATTPEPQAPIAIDLSLDDYTDTGLKDALAITEYDDKKYNTNVRIYPGAWVSGYMYNGTRSGAYAYGGGLGSAEEGTGDVHGTTFIALYGGKVEKDIYAAGTSGSVDNRYRVLKDDFDNDFIASSNAYIEGGTARNVYGGGWQGSVGYHEGLISNSTANDVPGETHVVIGKHDGGTFLSGLPAIERNAYGGGEGGAVFGTTNITLRNGFIGYRYFTEQPTGSYTTINEGGGYYQEKLDDETASSNGTNRLYDSGCIFGGGYIDNSSVDVTNVKMYGGHVRNALFGGGEIAAIGRGIIEATGENGSVRTLKGIYKAGRTNVELYEGHVHRNVFGGGRGYNNLGEGGTLYSDGYVFGQTNVAIHGGEVGNAELGPNEKREDNGNVFGGGDIGYVYSAYEKDGKLYVGIKDGERYDEGYEGKYYAYYKGDDPYIPAEFTYSETDPNWITYENSTEYVVTEDCKVLVEPYVRAKEAVTINGNSYAAGAFVPITDLNTLGNKNTSADKWACLDITGITIRNAVFAGGNTSSGSSTVFANATTVFGNATASIHDVYNRDLISIGSHHIGGLYGDGNLTFVDGYRGLNITNYGTDYYSTSPEIEKTAYELLPDREKAYYELRYKVVAECSDREYKNYKVGSTISRDELIALFDSPYVVDGEPNPAYFVESGMTRWAGRPLNTIQRADFCGVWGSRMVMQGAPDRVPETVDYNNYTINRVREVSLNKKRDPNNDPNNDHGNYFGIYNLVNFLGALSSDVNIQSERHTTATEEIYKPTAGQTYEQWKAAHVHDRVRNNGNSHNQVALASGVYLELTSEEGTGTGLYEKHWGYITGIIELDLINVQTGVGGGFVYAKNVHGVRSSSGNTHHSITELNQGAVSYKMYEYATDDSNKEEWQTSGNFVHSTQTIIDDCYNISAKYKGAEEPGGAVPAHYWFIKGSVYVYDQYISAYTGAPNAYSEQVEIPLTITAASHGEMKLLNVMPNRYAYYANYVSQDNNTPLTGDRKIVISDKEYGMNDPIGFWDWFLLTPAEQSLFVEDTYYIKEDCKIGDTSYTAGTVLLKSQYDAIRGTGVNPPTVTQMKEVNDEEQEVEVDFDFIFRSSNNLSHDTGYILTYKVNNPKVWDSWHTEFSSSNHDKLNTEEYELLSSEQKKGYNSGPTYYLNDADGSILGQRSYQVSDVISKEVYDTYHTAITQHAEAVPAGQATFKEAYIVTQQVTVPATTDTPEARYYVGSVVSATDIENTAFNGKVAEALVCTHTIQLSPTEFIYANTKMSQADKERYLSTYSENAALCAEINENIVPAYYCTHDGLYGGDYYEPGKNYRGLEAWSSMSEADRAHFTFNYDALDLLIDPTFSRNADGTIRNGLYEGEKYQYDSSLETLAGAEANPAQYSLVRPVDYTASYDSDENLTLNHDVTVNRNNSTITTREIQKGDELSRIAFESIPNEKRHYAVIPVNENTTIYVVKNGFQVGDSPYAVGQTIDEDTYNRFSEADKANVDILGFTNDDKGKKFYYCRQEYEIGHNGEGQAFTSYDNTNFAEGATVPVGVVISADTWNSLVNKQDNFIIHGVSPTETSTLYVSRESDIFDLSTEKIITVIYQYDYEESDTEGNITPVSERHVLNIHINFKSGIPLIEDIKKPKIILPGTLLSFKDPVVTSGAYEVTGGGWKLFETQDDAESHLNGIDYTPQTDLLYWYQDGYWVAYYAKTYLGETYSNHVQINVANYHDLTKVMGDKEHHYYVDNSNVHRDSKIYITDPENGIQQLKDFFDLSVHSMTEGVTDGKVSEEGSLNGHALLDEHVQDAKNLDFIMHTNVEVPDGTPWTPIANNDGECFEGTLHGDGYYISGLDNSLFNHLCGSVYNLGVTGPFTSAGIAETGSGYVENCWVSSSSTEEKTSKPVFGAPNRDGGGYQIVNSYYMENDDATNKYTNHDGTYGIPTRMSETAFYNGTVTYDLNGFYLYKRYCDNKAPSGSTTDYSYFTEINTDGTQSTPQTGHYGTGNAQYCSSGAAGVYSYGYVEDRYADGDFRYADGVIPETEDVRIFTDAQGKDHFYPIWPDDYIYFGQMLTYNWNASREHEDLPSRIYKSSGRLVANNQSNRVYRAPAYYRSKEMDVAHFNPDVDLVAYSKPINQYDTNLKAAYPNMTAIDFKGHNDTQYILGLNNNWFYQPLLDDDGLVSITNRDETPNLLVYAPSTQQNEKTYNVLNDYFIEPAYSDYYQDNDYRCVTTAPTTSVFGHLVQSELNTTNDHLLVDKKDFNCPIGYTFGTNYRMWYQRTPDTYVDLTKGWEGISIPFTAELVTTNQKGEITHFYSGSEESKNDTGTKLGHEYWLRTYRNISQLPSEATSEQKAEALFTYPNSTDSWEESREKVVKNSFLWDYYYEASSGHNHLDQNKDTYQTYYKPDDNGVVNTFNSYALLAHAVPYIIGFPGSTYYEFDLSGNFEAKTTDTPNPAKLGRQVITFASDKGGVIQVSDDEVSGMLSNMTYNGYTFHPNYLTKEVAAGAYMLNSEGSSYDVTAAATAGIPFRPYFTKTSSGARPATRSIVFSKDDSQLKGVKERGNPGDEETGSLDIYAKKHKIIVTSNLREATDVRIVNTAGITVTTFSLEPGETVETSINASGVYIVQPSETRFVKKLSVK